MRFVTSYRANKILYNFVVSNNLSGKIIVPANICPDVVETLVFAGLEPCFVDISSLDFIIDRQQVLSMADVVTAILCVHTYGVEFSLDDFYRQIKMQSPSVVIIDDRCLCVPNIELANSIADLTLYSMCSKKQVDMGVGGIGYIANDKYCYDEVYVPSNNFLSNVEYSFNQEQFIVCRDVVLKHKNELNKIYSNLLPSEIQMPSAYQNWRFNILVRNKDEILDAIFNAGLFASSHYQPLNRTCKNASDLHYSVINLFNDNYYSVKQAYRTCEIINNVLNYNYNDRI